MLALQDLLVISLGLFIDFCMIYYLFHNLERLKVGFNLRSSEYTSLSQI